mmetsp:Transcript_14278/g.21378  ORF Transcript_14278/g.21378 Transcript_14278/m.21378 type:complete len:2203 (+) Transcript_14278:135-6743(+)|eukprot:CAMPEP_0185035594 /NCGR_PEP_ID=MMETSP1103-20130426/27242_1 /TAXON_ID=36769 /ORGANISM="Paraphysomonas bandaiensis, Strain Caron Lab Isolate" /LENGTH=2202 /DNA_ID=CAMNT_0027572745 /DNA_START=76 /DNA_END=6687 /DNA_ORIENTATION=+
MAGPASDSDLVDSSDTDAKNKSRVRLRKRPQSPVERRRSSRTRKSVVDYTLGKHETEKRKERTRSVYVEDSADGSDSDQSPALDKKGKRTVKAGSNSFEKFGFKVTDKKSAVAKLSSDSRGISTSRSQNQGNNRKAKRKSDNVGSEQVGFRRSARNTNRVSYVDPISDMSSSESESCEPSDEGSESGSFQQKRVYTRRSKSKATRCASSEGRDASKRDDNRRGKANVRTKCTSAAGRKRGHGTDTLASVGSRRSSRQLDTETEGRRISYAEMGSDDEAFLSSTSEEGPHDSDGRNCEINSKQERKIAAHVYREDDSEEDVDDVEERLRRERQEKKLGGERAVLTKARRRIDKEVSSKCNDIDTEESGSDENENDKEPCEYRIQHLLACKSLTATEWREVCECMTTMEITRGSVLVQTDDEYYSTSPKLVEKFLVKWAHASYLHVSWETEDDLVNLVGPTAKTQIKRFRSNSVGGVATIFEDLRPGEYFPPTVMAVDRVIDVDDEMVDIRNIDWENATLPANPFDESSDIRGEEKKDDIQTSPECAKDQESRQSSSSDPMEVIDIATSPGNTSSPAANGKKRHRPLRSTRNVSPDTCSSNNSHISRRPLNEHNTSRSSEVPVFPFLHSDACYVTIKWENLPYSESTFENVADLQRTGVDYEKPLRDFYRREQLPPAKNSRHTVRRKLDPEVMKCPPKFRVGELRDYQWDGVRWLMFNWSQRRNSILADEMGLGKTIQTAAFLQMLSANQGLRGPFLVVAPLSTLVNWQREVSAWTDLDAIIYHGSQEDREIAREFDMFYMTRKHSEGYKMQVVITSPETCLAADNPKTANGRYTRALSKVRWDMLVVDEAHKLKNFSSKLSTTLREEYEYANCLLLTGTPLQNNTDELWTLLNFVDKKAFGDNEEFTAQFGDLKDSDQLDRLHQRLGPYLLRREKENVEKSVPPKEEVIVEVELTVPQKQYYRAIFEQNKNFLFRGANKDGPSLTNLAMELRKCCNHPYLVRGAETELLRHFSSGSETAHIDAMVQSSGKLVLLDKLLPKLRADGHRVLVFSQFRIMLDILEDYLSMRGFSHERIDGAVTGRRRQVAIDKYSEEGSNIFIMLLSTRAGGVGINLTAADTVIIFDSDWNPQNDIQAMARAHRIGQSRAVKVYRLLTCKTYEMQMFKVASLKLGLDYAIMHNIKGHHAAIGEKKKSSGMNLSTKEIEGLLRHGAYDIFREEKEGIADKESTNFCESDIDQILQRSTVIIHDKKDCKGPSTNFSKASFVASGSDADVDINDPDFWTKVVGLTMTEEIEQRPKKRACAERVGNYAETQILHYDSSAYSDSDSSNSSTRKPRGRKQRTRALKLDLSNLQEPDWTEKNLSNLQAALLTRGYGNWEKIRLDAKLPYALRDIARGCRMIVLYMIRVICQGDTLKSINILKNGIVETQIVAPDTPVDGRDNINEFVQVFNNSKLARLAYLSYLLDKGWDGDTECATAISIFGGTNSESDSLPESVIMRKSFSISEPISPDYQYCPGASASWNSTNLLTRVLQVIKTLPLPAEFCAYKKFIDKPRLRNSIKKGFFSLEDLFEVYHAFSLNDYSPRPSNNFPEIGDNTHQDTPTEGDDGLHYLRKSLVTYLKKGLIVEDSPAEWWVTGEDDLLLMRAVMQEGMPDSKAKLIAVEEYMMSSPDGPMQRKVSSEYQEETFLVGGSGYTGVERDISPLDKYEVMRRLRDIISILRNGLDATKNNWFYSNLVKSLGRYGTPWSGIDDIIRKIEVEGCIADWGIPGLVTCNRSVEDEAAKNLHQRNGGALRKEYLPSWKGLADTLQCKIVRMSMLKEQAVQVFEKSSQQTSTTKQLATLASKTKTVNALRLFLCCHSDDRAEELLQENFKDLYDPLNFGMLPLWWSPKHDIRLLKLVCLHGMGNYKAMLTEQTPDLDISTVPRDFVVPPRHPNEYPPVLHITHGLLSLRLSSLSMYISSLFIKKVNPVSSAVYEPAPEVTATPVVVRAPPIHPIKFPMIYQHGMGSVTQDLIKQGHCHFQVDAPARIAPISTLIAPKLNYDSGVGRADVRPGSSSSGYLLSTREPEVYVPQGLNGVSISDNNPVCNQVKGSCAVSIPPVKQAAVGSHCSSIAVSRVNISGGIKRDRSHSCDDDNAPIDLTVVDNQGCDHNAQHSRSTETQDPVQTTAPPAFYTSASKKMKAAPSSQSNTIMHFFSKKSA